jgi:hypothetical protein
VLTSCKKEEGKTRQLARRLSDPFVFVFLFDKQGQVICLCIKKKEEKIQAASGP